MRYNEEVIERFVRFPDTLPSELRHAVRDHIREDPRADGIARFYRSYYEMLEAIPERPPCIGAFVRCLFQPVPTTSS